MGATEDRKLALAKLEVRAEKRSYGDDEISEVIEQEALSRSPQKSVPPPLSWLFALVRLVPPRQRLWPVLVVLGLVAAYAAQKAGLF